MRTKNKVTQSSFCHCSDTSDRCWVVQITDSLDKKATEKLLLLRKRSLINPSAPWFPHSWWSAAEEMPSRVHAALEWGSKGARTALFPVISHHHQHPHTWPALLQLSRTQLGVFHMCSFSFLSVYWSLIRKSNNNNKEKVILTIKAPSVLLLIILFDCSEGAPGDTFDFLNVFWFFIFLMFHIES